MYVEVPSNQAGEVNVGEGVGQAHRLGGPREGAGVDICKSKLCGGGAKTTSGGINVKVKNFRRRGRSYRKDTIK